MTDKCKYDFYDVHVFVDILQSGLEWDPTEEMFDPAITILNPIDMPLNFVNIDTEEEREYARLQIKRLFDVDITITEDTKFLELLDAVSNSCPDWYDRALAFCESIKEKTANKGVQAIGDKSPQPDP